MNRDTPWETGRFDAKSPGARQILFGRMYEDAAIERGAFPSGGDVFCIASAGCMAIELAARHRVTAVDINPVQLAYAQRRAAGGQTRVGAAEHIVGIGRRLMSLFGWRRTKLEAFLDLGDCGEQVAFWRAHLDTRAFRLATDTLLSVGWLRAFYAAPFLEVLPRHFGSVLRSRLERAWRTHPNRDNPYARALLLGVPSGIAPSVQSSIRFVCADAAEFLESSPAASFDALTLSNILDGAPETYRDRLLSAVRRAARADAVVVSRSFREPIAPTGWNQAERDRSILWGVVDVRPARDL